MSDQPSGDSREAREWAEKVAAEWQKGCRASFVQLLAERLDAYHAHRSAADRQRIAELELKLRIYENGSNVNQPLVDDIDRWRVEYETFMDKAESELEKLRGLLREIQSYPNSVVSRFTAEIRRALSGEERDSRSVLTDGEERRG